MKTTIYILLFFFPLGVYSQEKLAPTANFLFFSAGIGNYTAYDGLMSPLMYSGAVFGPQVGFMWRSEKAVFAVKSNYSFGKSKTKDYPYNHTFRTTNHLGEFSISYLRNFLHKMEKKWTMYLGGSWDNMVNVRDHPWLFIYGELSTGITVDLLFQRNFIVGRHGFKFSCHSTLPLSSMIVVPQYAYSPPPPFQEQNAYYRKGRLKRAFQSLEPAFFTKFFRFKNSIQLEKSIKGCNKIFLGYDYMMVSYHKAARVRTGRSYFQLGTKICL